MTEETPPQSCQTFEQWLTASMPTIAAGQKLLEKTLEKGTADYNQQAAEIEDAFRHASDLLAEANAWLDDLEYRELMAMNRDQGTASERKIVLNFKLKDRRMLRDKIKGLSEALKSRMKRAQWQI